jgi:hypothetical protein
MLPVVAALSIATYLGGCNVLNKTSNPPTAAPEPRRVALAAGTRVPLLLLQTLESGQVEEGTDVAFLVGEDVKDAQGNVLISKGSPAQGRVTWSRREEMLGGLMNRPARLKVQLLATVATDGQAVDLAAAPDQPEEPYEFNRGNTGRTAAMQQLETIAQDAENAAVLQAMENLVEGKESVLLAEQESRERLAKIGRELQLPALAGLAQQNEVGKVKSLLERLRGAGPITAVAKHIDSADPAMAAVLEWTGVASAVSSRLQGLTHGRNIKAYVGTPVDAYVKGDGTVTIGKGRG